MHQGARPGVLYYFPLLYVTLLSCCYSILLLHCTVLYGTTLRCTVL